jgi:hypothetical protein
MRYMMFIKHTQDYGNVQPPAGLSSTRSRVMKRSRWRAASWSST